jgi:uncharacterized repeat protein (TIGR03843 family)
VSIDEILATGELVVTGRFTNSSNSTLLATATLGEQSVTCIYKPEAGERPLWDFPQGLWRREVAAYRLSRHLGLDLIPTTVVRADGPFGPGSVQAYVEEDMAHHYFTLRDDARHHEWLQQLAVFDVVANNADRKSGHVLLADGRLWAIDHGLCFHEEDKLRTVVWDFAGEPIDEATLPSLVLLADDDLADVADLLSPIEVALTARRAAELLEAGSLPFPDEDADWPPYPWPLI